MSKVDFLVTLISKEKEKKVFPETKIRTFLLSGFKFHTIWEKKKIYSKIICSFGRRRIRRVDFIIQKVFLYLNIQTSFGVLLPGWRVKNIKHQEKTGWNKVNIWNQTVIFNVTSANQFLLSLSTGWKEIPVKQKSYISYADHAAQLL